LKNFIEKPEIFFFFLILFSSIELKLPDICAKNFVETEPITLCVKNGRENLISQIYSLAKTNSTANLAISAFRDVRHCGIKPFMKAAFERNPVCFEALKNCDFTQIYEILKNFENESIYKEDFRLAQPDEVYNFKRGDGLEKAILLATLIFRKTKISPKIENNERIVEIAFEQKIYSFETNKNIPLIKDYYD
jgi:hypothetical protein